MPAVYDPVRLADDRSISVPPGHLVRTAYVPVHDVLFACRERMAVGDVAAAFQKRIQLGAHQPWPCPRGYWDGERFVIVDGRHEYVATLMLGHTHILVAWSEPAAPSTVDEPATFGRASQDP